MGATKNLGQVAGLYIGTSAPSNTTLIWFDSTPAIMCHKVYDAGRQQWTVLDSNAISEIDYDVLKNLASTRGLSVGQWFQIRDKSNALALAITSTKVQYADNNGNLVIDDLGGSVQYLVTHNNILIDDIAGVWDDTEKKVVFTFTQETPDVLNEDYLLAKSKRNNVWTLVKFKLSSFLSNVSGNSLTWNNGFYLNFTARLQALLDVVGGAVSKSAFDNAISGINQNLSNVSNNVQNVQQQAAASIAVEVTNEKIYNKQLPEEPTPGAEGAIHQGDTLKAIVFKCQRWFDKLRWADGIGLSNSYSEKTSDFDVNTNDSIETAIEKLAGHIRALQTGSDNGTDNVILSPGYAEGHNTIVPGTTKLTDVLEELAFRISRNIQPIYSVIAFYKEPTYDNVMQYAGYGWFPCVRLYADTAQELSTQLNNWRTKYPELTVNIGYDFGKYYMNFSKVTVNGETRDIPNFTGKFLRAIAKEEEVKNTGGADSVSIEANHLPEHTHPASCGQDGNHNHGGSTGYKQPSITPGKVKYTAWESGAAGYSKPFQYSNVPESGDHYDVESSVYGASVESHNHDISDSGTHNHPITIGNNTTTHQNLPIVPSYIATAYLIRLL